MNEPFANSELNALRMELAERLGTVEAKLENLTTEIAYSDVSRPPIPI